MPLGAAGDEVGDDQVGDYGLLVAVVHQGTLGVVEGVCFVEDIPYI
jgi:hypothetical protein